MVGAGAGALGRGLLPWGRLGTDHELFAAWQGGDRAAGELLFERHYAVVCRFFWNKANEADLDDLVQLVFVRALEVSDRVRPDARFGGFLIGVARNILREHFRRKHRDGRFVDLETSVAAELSPSPSSIIAREDAHRVVLDALRSIALDLQIVLELAYWEGWTSNEIAQSLEIPLGTAKSRLRRAKSALLEAMEQQGAAPLQEQVDAIAGAVGKLAGRPASA